MSDHAKQAAEAHLKDKQKRELYYCSLCGHIDHDCQGVDGFWEKGYLGECEVFYCPGCGEITQIKPVIPSVMSKELIAIDAATAELREERDALRSDIERIKSLCRTVRKTGDKYREAITVIEGYCEDDDNQPTRGE